MADAYRENAAGEFEIFPHRMRGWYDLAVAGLLAAPLGFALALGAREPILLVLGLLVIALVAFAVRDIKRGSSDAPIATVGETGFHDHASRTSITWAEVERIELFSWGFEMSVSRYAAFHPRESAPTGPPGFNVDLSRLGTTEEEFVGILRRFWGGEIGGYRGELPARDAPITRPPRWRRFLRSVRWPALGLGVVIGVLLLSFWADP